MDFEATLREMSQLGDEPFKALFEKLTELGVASYEDARYIREEDLIDVLRPIPARRLVDKLRSIGNS
jgi:hypothetical protein